MVGTSNLGSWNGHWYLKSFFRSQAMLPGINSGTLVWSLAGVILDSLVPWHQPVKMISKGGIPPDLGCERISSILRYTTITLRLAKDLYAHAMTKNEQGFSCLSIHWLWKQHRPHMQLTNTKTYKFSERRHLCKSAWIVVGQTSIIFLTTERFQGKVAPKGMIQRGRDRQHHLDKHS